MEKKSFIRPPKKIPILIKLATWYVEKKTKKEMLVPKILAWHTKSAIGSGVLESMITHNDKEVPDRLLQLVRLQVATLIGCSFCIDMNMNEYDLNKITFKEIESLEKDVLSDTFSHREIVAIELTRMLTKTPITIDNKIIKKAKKLFSEREYVIICTTISQVNYWSRMIKGFGIKEVCPIRK